MSYELPPMPPGPTDWMKLDAVTMTYSAWQVFDLFWNRFRNNDSLHARLGLLRNLYAAEIEMSVVRPTGKTAIIRYTLALLREIPRTLFFRFVISNVKAEQVLLVINPTQDFKLARSLQIEPVSFNHLKLRPNFLQGLKILIIFFHDFWIIFLDAKINKQIVYSAMSSYLRALNLNEGLEFGQIKKIVTQRDRYPEELALILAANKKKIVTIKIDFFPNLNPVNQTTIACRYHYSPNAANRANFQLYPQNRNVIFVKGGFPYHDQLSFIKYQPIAHPKVITFATQYGYSFGYLGKYPCSYYINEILTSMPDNYILYVKLHPLENPSEYNHFLGQPKVRVLKPGEISNEEVFSISSFIFSIISQFSTDAKHVNPNSFYINYAPEYIRDARYSLIQEYLDLITSKNDLMQFLTGQRKAKDQKQFLQFFNATYPNTIEALRKTLDDL